MQTNDQELRESGVSSELIFDGQVVHLYLDRVLLPNGKPATREYLRHVGAVAVLPLFRDGTVACVRQYRYPHAAVLTEIPAGKLESKTEDHAQAALRELREETGCRCGRLTLLGRFYSSPAILDECIDLFLAEDLTPGQASPDEDEFVRPERLPLSRLVVLVLAGEIPDGKTQAAVLWVNELLRRRAREEVSGC